MTADDKPTRAPRKAAGNKGFAIAPRPGLTPPDEPEPVPAAPPAVVSTPPNVASLQASRRTEPATGRRTIDITRLMKPLPPPERDLVTVTFRVPRFVRDALYAQAVVEQRDQQELVIGALGRGLDAELVEVAYDEAKARYEAQR